MRARRPDLGLEPERFELPLVVVERRGHVGVALFVRADAGILRNWTSSSTRRSGSRRGTGRSGRFHDAPDREGRKRKGPTILCGSDPADNRPLGNTLARPGLYIRGPNGTAARPDRSTLSDGELVGLVRNGEADAYAELVRRTQRGGYRLARRITRNHDDADDVLQESYVKAYRALDRFAPDRPFGPWFLTIVARTARSWIRDAKRRTAEPLDEPGRDGAGPLAERVADPATGRGTWSGGPGSSGHTRGFPRTTARFSRCASRGPVVRGDRRGALHPVGTVMSRLARARESLVEILTN